MNSAVIEMLTTLASDEIREQMSTRYGIHTRSALGVSMASMKDVARQFGRSHELAATLWDTGLYEARMVACMVDEPDLVDSAQMDRWCDDFDNWAICDTVCFNLFDRTADAWSKVEQWANRPEEFVKRAAFALIWSLALHDKGAGDERFVAGLALIEQHAIDDRPYVRKAIAMALKAVGKRNLDLRESAVKSAGRLAEATAKPARTIGKEALRALA